MRIEHNERLALEVISNGDISLEMEKLGEEQGLHAESMAELRSPLLLTEAPPRTKYLFASR